MMSVVVALLAEGVDRNTKQVTVSQLAQASPSSRRAWIEIPCRSPARSPTNVALLAEGVDRNFLELVYSYLTPVVALLAEGVDRNVPLDSEMRNAGRSPSSRRAWIEMP